MDDKSDYKVLLNTNEYTYSISIMDNRTDTTESVDRDEALDATTEGVTTRATTERMSTTEVSTKTSTKTTTTQKIEEMKETVKPLEKSEK